jgi:DNA polymerase III epsilon subunit-like protein
MTGLQYYVIDTETTGLNSTYHEMTEVSIVRCSDRVQLTQFIKCDYPERAAYDALAITKKTLADLEKGDLKENVVNKINKFLDEDGLTAAHRCFIAHNWSFDKKFVHALYEKVGQACPVNLWLCSMALTKQYAKNIGLVKPKVNLHAALDIIGIKKFSDAHSSKVDSRNTYLLYRDLVENKKVDYLPFIKTAVHEVNYSASDDDGMDMSLLD